MKNLEYYAKLFDKLLLGAILKAPNEVEIALKREGILQVTAFLKKSNYKLEKISYEDEILNYEFSVEKEKEIPKIVDKKEDESESNEESKENGIIEESSKDEDKKSTLDPILWLVTEKIIIKIDNLYNRVDSICFHYPKAGDIEIELAKKENIDFIGNIKLYEIRETELKEKRKREEELEKERRRKEKEKEIEESPKKDQEVEEKEKLDNCNEEEAKIDLEFEETTKE